VLLAVIHLMHSPDIAWRAITMAALLVIPVTALTHFVVERPSIMFGRCLTGRSAADSSRAKTVRLIPIVVQIAQASDKRRRCSSPRRIKKLRGLHSRNSVRCSNAGTRETRDDDAQPDSIACA
jgi:hypothetical protein